jgi:glycosyltransferase involved in cell wall biosynthesis
MSPIVPPMGPLAYVTSTYPAASHTFILREITALEELGFDILPCAIRPPAPNNLIGPEERAAHAKTLYVLKSAKTGLPLGLFSALKRPKTLWRALKLAVRTAPPGLRGALKQCFYLGEAMILARHLRRKGITHIHNHFADHSANVSMLTSELSGIPFSYTLHGPNELFEADKWYFAQKTARARFVACISHFARSQAMYFSDPAHWDKLKIVHCGVVPERYGQSLKPKLEPDKTEILFVGRLTPVKGVRVLLQAMQQVRAQNPNISLKIIGDGEDRAHLETLARPFGDAVRFMGYQSQAEVAQAMAGADALVLPSFAEGLPVVLMEALAAGTPVICSQVAGVNELVEQGVCGFVVPAGDTETLAARILELAADPARARAMGVRGQERVRAEFDIHIEAARIGALFAGQGGDGLRPAILSPIKGRIGP